LSQTPVGASWESHPWELSWTPRVSLLHTARNATGPPSSDTLWCQPSFFVFDTEDEESCFDFFKSYSVNEFTVLFPLDWEFWGSTVLSISMLQPAIRHSISALGALHRQYTEGRECLLPEDANHHKLVRYGLSQYTKALKAFADLAVSQTAIDRLFATIACVLIIHISSLQGFQAACLRHLANALKLYSDLQATVQYSHGTIYDNHIRSLRSILLSLQSQARSLNCDQVQLNYISFSTPTPEPDLGPFSHAASTNQSRTSSTSSRPQLTPTSSASSSAALPLPQPNIQPYPYPSTTPPLTFSTTTSARDYYTLLANDLQHLAPSYDEARAAAGPLQNFCQPLLSKLLLAEDALRRLQIEQMDKIQLKPKLALSHLTLQLDYCCLDLYLRVFPLMEEEGEMAWDGFGSHMRRVVALCAQILGVGDGVSGASTSGMVHGRGKGEQERGVNGKLKVKVKPTFCTAQGVIGPLFVVAMHCRISSVRREAVRLLKLHPRREGLWDNGSAVRVALEVVELEERLWRERLGVEQEELEGRWGGYNDGPGFPGEQVWDLYEQRAVWADAGKRRRTGGFIGRDKGKDPAYEEDALIARDCRVIDLEVVHTNPRLANIRLRTEKGWGEWGRRNIMAW
jgi:hypothetical protein